MSQPAWATRGPARNHACRSLLFGVLLAGSVAFAERLTVNPETQLSMDFSLEGATVCIRIPTSAFDPQACAGIPREEVESSQRKNVRAQVVLRQPEHVLVLTVASIPRPGIGQMYDQQIQGFIEGTMQNLSQEFGASTHLVDSKASPYTLEKVGTVPVARWEYTTDLPESDLRANTASAVVYLIPSRDTLDILSLNTHRRDLDAARKAGAQIISTMQVPLTIDAKEFGGNMPVAMGMNFGTVMVPVVLVIGIMGLLWWRHRRASRR
ncbi:hypothetical protein [Hyalangium versicolor]|uniref:hypothetical protein n=1 Tax=Hyalangium versicolor TaxID=2861190 RepID=UPI001CCDD82B|nr:hypothetical protein [Hyalangium versicolor]